MKPKTPAQLGRLAAKLPGATPDVANKIEDQLVAGFYGRESLNELAGRVFGNPRSASAWLKKPCTGLSGRVPASMAKTKVGRVELRAFLIGIGNGNFM